MLEAKLALCCQINVFMYVCMCVYYVNDPFLHITICAIHFMF